MAAAASPAKGAAAGGPPPSPLRGGMPPPLTPSSTASPTNGFHSFDCVSEDWQCGDESLRRWLRAPGNKACFECQTPLEPRDVWVSVTHAISLCDSCAGLHRALGSHLSKVKSVALDVWKPHEVNRLMQGGNWRCAAALGMELMEPRKLADLEELRRRCFSEEMITHCVRLSGKDCETVLHHESPVPGTWPVTSGDEEEALRGAQGYFRTKSGGIGFNAPPPESVTGGWLFRCCCTEPSEIAVEVVSPVKHSS